MHPEKGQFIFCPFFFFLGTHPQHMELVSQARGLEQPMAGSRTAHGRAMLQLPSTSVYHPSLEGCSRDICLSAPGQAHPVPGHQRRLQRRRKDPPHCSRGQAELAQNSRPKSEVAKRLCWGGHQACLFLLVLDRNMGTSAGLPLVCQSPVTKLLLALDRHIHPFIHSFFNYVS